MPPGIFIHYLEHGDDVLNRNRNEWFDTLPMRKHRHTSARLGYGVHVIEGPHRWGVFKITMAVVICDVVLSILYSVLYDDVQGGTGIGALVIACYTAFLGGWIFWRSGT